MSRYCTGLTYYKVIIYYAVLKVTLIDSIFFIVHFFIISILYFGSDINPEYFAHLLSYLCSTYLYIYNYFSFWIMLQIKRSNQTTWVNYTSELRP